MNAANDNNRGKKGGNGVIGVAAFGGNTTIGVSGKRWQCNGKS